MGKPQGHGNRRFAVSVVKGGTVSGNVYESFHAGWKGRLVLRISGAPGCCPAECSPAVLSGLGGSGEDNADSGCLSSDCRNEIS